MRILHLPAFWQEVQNAPHRLLALDYDGTLAPFHVDPMQAYPLDGVTDVLKALARCGHTAVAVTSGRPVYELLTLMGELDIFFVGCHGYEVLDPARGLVIYSPEPRQLEGLERALEMASEYGYLHKVEVKIGSLAFHTRGVPLDTASRMEAHMFREWSQLSEFGLGCRRFNGGVEVHCKGWNKGDSINRLLRSQPPGTLPVYLGDDATDEDAFRLMRARGIGIRVGVVSNSTAAKGFVKDCRGVVAMLEHWVELFSNGGG